VRAWVVVRWYALLRSGMHCDHGIHFVIRLRALVYGCGVSVGDISRTGLGVLHMGHTWVGVGGGGVGHTRVCIGVLHMGEVWRVTWVTHGSAMDM
jgi:hypothetical protein